MISPIVRTAMRGGNWQMKSQQTRQEVCKRAFSLFRFSLQRHTPKSEVTRVDVYMKQKDARKGLRHENGRGR